MNAEHLLAYYDRIAEAPNAIAQLRQFILDLAVRGKLVEQDLADKPAPVTAAAVNQKRRIRGQSGDFVEVPYALPFQWAWRAMVTLADQVTDGEHSTPPRITEQIIPLVTAKNVRDGYMDYTKTDWVSQDTAEKAWRRCRPVVGDLLLVCVGATTGRLSMLRQPHDMVLVRSVALIRPNRDANPEYLERAIRSPAVQAQIWASVKVSAQPCLYINRIQSLLIPLPPLAEQRRIVAKVDELMALCDRLEEAHKEREAARDCLTAASFARLNMTNPDPAAFTTHARFALDNLPALTTRADQIKQLRQTILNIAVRGMLVEQDAADESANELLTAIASDKRKLREQGEIRQERPLPLIQDSDCPFGIPSSWAWVRLGDIAQLVTSGSRDWAKYYADSGAIFVRMGNLSKGDYRLRMDNIQHVRPPASGEGTRTKLEAGDILISITGDVGMLGLIPENFGEAYINQHVAMFRPMPAIKGRFLAELFRSPFAQDQFNEPQRGIKNSFRLTDVTHFLVPVPPLAEQCRIVTKLDELMALCDRLEANLATGDDTRQRLLEATLHEALEPTKVRALEPA